MYEKPGLCLLLTRGVNLRRNALDFEYGLASDANERYEALLEQDIDELYKTLDFREGVFTKYIFARTQQDVTLKSIGRNDLDCIVKPEKFSNLTYEEIRDSFADRNDRGEILIGLSTYKKNKKDCYLWVLIPYENHYLLLEINRPGYAGLILASSSSIVELSKKYEFISDPEVHVVKDKLDRFNSKY